MYQPRVTKDDIETQGEEAPDEDLSHDVAMERWEKDRQHDQDRHESEQPNQSIKRFL